MSVYPASGIKDLLTTQLVKFLFRKECTALKTMSVKWITSVTQLKSGISWLESKDALSFT